MSKRRWYRAKWHTGIRNLAEALSKASFQLDAGEGFVLDRVRDDFLEARYAERVHYTDSIIDPLGGEQQVDRTDYRQVQFRMETTGFGLELVNATRSSSRLVSRLTDVLGFNFSISPVIVDVPRWADQIQQATGGSVQTNLIQVGAIDLSGGSVGRLVVKGTSEVTKAALDLAGARTFLVEKMQMKLPRGLGSVTLASNASAKVSGTDETSLVSMVRQALLTTTVS